MKSEGSSGHVCGSSATGASGTASSASVCVHGHFYQPPREDPWSRRIPVELTAAPFHNWNERITQECYRPNTSAKLDIPEVIPIGLRPPGTIRPTAGQDNRGASWAVNNFEWMSFDFGPTLLNWIASAHPGVYDKIREGDRMSRDRCAGHGNAMAQAYVHLIMPLASRRDKLTMIRWGLQDFRRHFGRKAEGMWLPETAVDRETLDLMAQEGVGFTVLAPRQAVGQPPSTWEAFRCPLREGRSINVFFYDANLSQAIAFGGILRHAGDLERRMAESLAFSAAVPRLLNVAVDGETFGHHFPGGEATLAFVFHRLVAGGNDVTNYAAFLADHPPLREIEVVEQSSWSCAHGVERWRADCGCRTRDDRFNQAWRGPLREAMDRLRDRVDVVFEERGSRLFRDAWEARDDYVRVMGGEGWAAFWQRHQRGPSAPADEQEAIELLEMERNRLFMYTSCGWFFDELSGLETLIILRYAARVIEAAEHLTGQAWEEGWLAELEKAPSHIPEFRNGRGVWNHFIHAASLARGA